MSSLAVTNIFVASTVAESAKVNQNFDDIEAYINARNSGSTAWDNVLATTVTVTTLNVTSLSFIPSGTKMLFYQASAPTGWTAISLNNKFLRVVTAAGTGGTSGGSGLTPSSTLTLAHTHTVNSHTHTTPASGLDRSAVTGQNGSEPITEAGNTNAITSLDSDGSGLRVGYVSGAGTDIRKLKNNVVAGITGGTSPGTDTQLSTTAFQYADVIAATKD